MNEALNEAVYERFRFIEWDIILASIHSLFKGSIQPSNASYCSPSDEGVVTVVIKGVVTVVMKGVVTVVMSGVMKGGMKEGALMKEVMKGLQECLVGKGGEA
jgi:hypothetical protein